MQSIINAGIQKCFGLHENIQASIFRRCLRLIWLFMLFSAARLSPPVRESLWDRHWVAMTTVFVLRLAGRLPRQQPRRAASTAGEGAPPPSPPRGRLSSARKVPRSDATGGRRGSRGRRRRRGGSETSSTSLSPRTASSGPPFASPLMPTGSLMKRDVPHPTR